MALLSAFWASQEVLDFIGAALRRYGIGLRGGARAEEASDQARALEILERGDIRVERPAARENLGHRMLAVDQNQQSAHVDGEAHLPFGQFLGAQLGLDVDLIQIHFYAPLVVRNDRHTAARIILPAGWRWPTSRRASTPMGLGHARPGPSRAGAFVK